MIIDRGNMLWDCLYIKGCY